MFVYHIRPMAPVIRIDAFLPCDRERIGGLKSVITERATDRYIHPSNNRSINRSPTYLVRISLDGIATDNEKLVKVPRDVHGISRRSLQPREERVGLMPIHIDLHANTIVHPGERLGGGGGGVHS